MKTYAILFHSIHIQPSTGSGITLSMVIHFHKNNYRINNQIYLSIIANKYLAAGQNVDKIVAPEQLHYWARSPQLSAVVSSIQPIARFCYPVVFFLLLLPLGFRSLRINFLWDRIATVCAYLVNSTGRRHGKQPTRGKKGNQCFHTPPPGLLAYM